jgi:hypothetical protein
VQHLVITYDGYMTRRRLTAATVGTVLALATTLVVGATPAYAYDTFHDHRLWGGVGDYGYNNQYYYVDGSAGAHFSTIVTAMDDWIYTPTEPVSRRRSPSSGPRTPSQRHGHFQDQLCLAILGPHPLL